MRPSSPPPPDYVPQSMTNRPHVLAIDLGTEGPKLGRVATEGGLVSAIAETIDKLYEVPQQ